MGNSDENRVAIKDCCQLVEDFSALCLNQNFSDITLILDGENIYAHKVILAARSEYFEALLYDGGQEIKQTEITITDASPGPFRKLLKYIYTGTVTLEPSNMSFTLELLGLSHRFSMKHLASVLVEKLKTMLDLKNICSILNSANLYDLKELRDACHVFMDKHASEVLANDCFSDLIQISMIKLLQRDSFFAPEIEIFKSAAKWCKTNNDIDDLVVQCVRLSWLTVVEIVSIVWPSKLVNSENLLQAIAEIVEVKPKLSCCRAKLLTDVNVAKAEYKSQVIFGSKTTFLLTGNRNVDKYAECAIGDKNGFTIKLGFPVFLNHVNMMLWDNDGRYYSYYVEVSIDQKKWKKIVDYSQYACRSHQELYFDKQIVQYVRIVGTHNTANPAFHLIFVEAYFKSKIPRVVNGILCPTTNVATKDKKAVVVEGINPAALLDGVTTNYGNFTSHNIGSGSIVVQLAQPYMISSVKLLLWDQDTRAYKYYIETSVNKSDWTVVADHKNEASKSWQTLRFTERPVVFIRITGTDNTANKSFHCLHFECPVDDDQSK